MSKRRTYSKQFKLDVIKQSYQRDNIRELAELKKKLADVRMECDILKREMGIFTKKNG